VGGTISLSSVNVELDGNSAEGVLTFAADGRQTLQGTLAADSLDLTPYVSTVRLLAANERAWNNGQITLNGLAGLDLDLRLSAASVVVSNAKVGRTAIAANLRNGHLVVTVGEAQAYGGVVKGSLALSNFEQGVEVKSQLQFTDVDLESCLGQLFGLRRLEGKGNIALAVDGTGDSVLAVTHTLNGTATLTGSNGALAGLNVEQLLRRLERRPLSGGGEFRSGRTPYDKISVALKVAQGTVTVEDVKIEGSAVVLALAGLNPGARTRSEGYCRPGDTAQARHHTIRVAVHRAGFVGRSDHATRPRSSDSPFRRRRSASQCSARAPFPRLGSFGHRAADWRGTGGRHCSGSRSIDRTAGDRKDRITATSCRAAKRRFDYHFTGNESLAGGPRRLKFHTCAPKAARSRRTAPRLAISDDATVPNATNAIIMVHTALISGFTPRRTSE
jgi:hypothetical protein